MRSEELVDRSEGNRGDGNTHFVANADEISLETLINLLAQKKLITVDELFSLESRMRDYKQYRNDVSYVNIKNNYDRGRFPELKKTMSRHRWSRRLGSFLFGWKWKKVKKNPTYQ